MAHQKISRYERIVDLCLALFAADGPRTLSQLVGCVPGYPDLSDPQTLRTAFERDKKILRSEGILIDTDETDGSANAGYRLGRPEESRGAVYFTADERASLALALSCARFEHHRSHSAMAKLAIATRTCPRSTRLPASAAEALVQMAVTQRRPIHFVFNDRHQDVDPYGLAAFKGDTIMVGRDRHVRSRIRCYRVSRISSVPVLGGPGEFEIPPQFDPRCGPFALCKEAHGETEFLPERPRAESARSRFRRLVAMLSYLAETSEASVTDLARCFQLRPSDVVRELEFAACCGVAPFTPDRLLNLVIEEETVKTYDLQQFRRETTRLSFAEIEAVVDPARSLLAVPGLINRAPLERAFRKALRALGEVDPLPRISLPSWPSVWSQLVRLKVHSVTPEIRSVIIDTPRPLNNGYQSITAFLADRRWHHAVIASQSCGMSSCPLDKGLTMLAPEHDRRAA